MSIHSKITPFLWFSGQAEEAATFYVSIFPDSQIRSVTRYPEAGADRHKQKPGSAMTVVFELAGQSFIALNGGNHAEAAFNDSISFSIDCKDQDEVDYYWTRLREGGKEKQCGWLADKFGVVWQVVPSELPKLLGSDDRDGANRAMEAMMGMVKLDINVMKAAFEGR